MEKNLTPADDTGHFRSFSMTPVGATPTQSLSVWSQHSIVQAVARESVRDLNRPLSRMDVFYTGSTTNLRKRSGPSIVGTAAFTYFLHLKLPQRI
ncbi:hypothetical protein KIN20_026916 [Parelaphostrongylus tenuis]|uniref:Uncharacterized protein n=1 Tax=Parelaphostrongylus tenuis TaxID=148309 RepID=A0AAD5WD88_PARTN|nr:hypothetical protein KIN20_026916 [Parelaphostrongylus tenuis]